MADRVLVNANIPAAFQDTLLCDYDPIRGDPAVLEKLRSWEPTVSNPGLVLVGEPGLAKTMLSCALLNEAQANTKTAKIKGANSYLRQQKYPVYFIQLAELIDMHLRSYRLHDLVKMGIGDQSEYFEIDKLLRDLQSRVKRLVIDDVGKEHITSSGFAEDVFDLLVRTRHNKGLTTIFTSNIPLSRWSTQYSKSMKSLILRSCLVINVR